MARLLNLETSDEVKDIIEAGYVLKPHGIRGKLKVRIYDEFVSFLEKNPVFINNREYLCESVKSVPNDIFIMTLKEVKDRELSEELSGSRLFVKEDLLKADVGEDPDSFSHQTLIGMEVWSHLGEFLGKVSNTFRTDFSDYIETDDDYIIPFMKRYILDISREKNRIEVEWEEDDED